VLGGDGLGDFARVVFELSKKALVGLDEAAFFFYYIKCLL